MAPTTYGSDWEEERFMEVDGDVQEIIGDNGAIKRCSETRRIKWSEINLVKRGGYNTNVNERLYWI